MSARPATVTAVSASISTPVLSAVFTTQVISTPESPTASVTDTPCSAIGVAQRDEVGRALGPHDARDAGYA
ncbi:hypothetical protein GCM10020219_061810 [Nonomuraea dietziae]